MQRFILHPTPLFRSSPNPSTAWTARRFATAFHHPNPGNFANRPREQLSEAGRKGGRKGGKAHGGGGFHNMDPEKQHEIASRGGHASRKAAQQQYQVPEEEPVDPATAPPGFERSASA
ncbi:KGG domain-containing protein [Aspergillus ruber CBS 135680]|uniref:Conidiation-specific protein Con-10 n=1 Tax=Aspergillus ruber (strain CBS 135680) TaxID=1388766 RepID=A0A017SFM8_ASPRC|nr:uncharacterized protein EURHEDRAFT_411550 [Aspergillus ruber CBS 135680]EYE95828.1 hypothetical protein EURHEDRAFT_411550 [Aspergillus ruber CBS 135680]